MIRGIQVHGTKRRKAKKKSKSLLKAEADMEKFYTKMGIDTNKKSDHRYDMPDYNTGPRMTSDEICSNGTKKDAMKYTGNEIAGIVTTHKSNLMPVRKDNKQAAVDAANMRR